MPTVTVSPKYQIVIPREVRESLGIRPGQKIEFLEIDGVLSLVPIPDDIREMRGFAKGIDTTVERDRDDRV